MPLSLLLVIVTKKKRNDVTQRSQSDVSPSASCPGYPSRLDEDPKLPEALART